MNMLKEKHFFIKLISVLAVFCGFVCFCAADAFAAEVQTVRLIGGGSEAEIVLNFPEAAKEEISSLQISISVSLSADNASVEFVPNSSLAAKIAEGRYNKESGILNIYAAGTAPLFDKENPVLSLGHVKISGSGCYADLKIVKDSLKFVRGTELVVQDTGVEYSEELIRIAAENTADTGNNGGGGFIVPDVTSAADEPVQTTTEETSAATLPAPETSAPSTSSTSAGGAGNTSGQTKPEENVPAIPVEGESVSRADTERLSEAVSRAEQYKRSDYTDSSYQLLNEAVGRAKALLSDSGASQEQVDEALLILENAIGMLVHANSSSEIDVKPDLVIDQIETAENTEDTTAVISEENGNESTTAPITAETAPNTADTTTEIPSANDFEQGNGSASDNAPEAPEESGSLTVWIIVLVVLGAAVAVIAAAAVVNANKKKSAKGSHSKARSRNRDDRDQ